MKLVNLLPLKEGGAFGMSAKDLAATYSLKMLQQMRDETMRDMENDPSVEPEGGSQADYYGGTLNGLDQAIALKQPKKDVPYDVAVGKMTQDEYDKMMSTVKSDRASFERSSYPTNQKLRMFRTGKKKAGGGLNESTESKWNSIDVSRKAEKEIDNKEWNERTAKKLDMLKSLNAAGKFKKDWDEEKLQGWVDQNYSWEKLSKQFKLNESYSEMYSEVDFEPEDMDNPDEDLVIIGSGYLDIKSNFKGRPNMTNDELATLGQKVVDQLHNGDKEAAMDYIMSQINEVDSEMFNRQGPRKPNLNSMADVDNTGWTPDGGGGSIGYMEYEDGTEMTPQEIQDYFEVNHELYDDIMQGLYETYNRGTVSLDGKEVDVESIEMDGLESMRKWGPDDGGPDAYILSAEFTDGTPLSDEQKYRFADEYPEITQEKAQEQMEEGSCGYGPDGVPGDTPGETKGMPADKRTIKMMREVIRKEIKKLHETK